LKNKSKGKSRLTNEEYRAGIMAIEAEPQNLKKFEGGYVGTLREITDADCIQTTMWMEGFQQIKATQLGLDLILLTSPVEGEIQRAYESNKQWWERWFTTLTPWRPDILPKGRRIWVRLFGVPLHIWSMEGFKKIIWRYGKLLNLDPETLEQSRLDVARAQIAVTYWEMVDEVIEVKVDEEIFIIRMVEERFGCLDLGVHKTAGSKNGVGESDYDSDSRVGVNRSRIGMREGWSEVQSEGEDSVNGGGEMITVGECVDSASNDQGIIGKGVSEEPQEEREIEIGGLVEKETAKGYGAEDVEIDRDRVDSGRIIKRKF
jgi:hypothetical protein